jgi:hypothetical protein
VILNRLSVKNFMDSDSEKEFTEGDLVPRQRSIMAAIRENHPSNPPYWVTAGRTIENYLPDEIISTLQFQDPRTVSSALSSDKVKFALDHRQDVTAANFDRYSLGEQIQKLVDIIRSWNR